MKFLWRFYRRNLCRDCPNVSPEEIFKVISDNIPGGISKGTVEGIPGGFFESPVRASGENPRE